MSRILIGFALALGLTGCVAPTPYRGLILVDHAGLSQRLQLVCQLGVGEAAVGEACTSLPAEPEPLLEEMPRDVLEEDEPWGDADAGPSSLKRGWVTEGIGAGTPDESSRGADGIEVEVPNAPVEPGQTGSTPPAATTSDADP